MLRIEVPVTEADFAADLLWSAGASAVGEEAAGAVVVLTADLSACPAPLRHAPHSVAEDDGTWADGWRPFARAAVAGPFFVRPPWIDAPVPDGAIELVVDAGRAFGTGTHPSTLLALRALAADRVRPGDAVLDAGCGSGTLAIAAARLGAGTVVAVDRDPAAVVAAAANVERNRVAGVVQVVGADVADVDGSFDVVVANLGSPLVHELAPVLLASTRPGGALILSGMLGDHRDRAALPVDEHLEAEGWTCLVTHRER